MNYSTLRATRDPAALFGLDKQIVWLGLAGVLAFVPIEAGLWPESVRPQARRCLVTLFCAGGVILLGNKIADWRIARGAGHRDRGLAVPLADGVTCVGRPAELRRLASKLLKTQHRATRHAAVLTRGRWQAAMLCVILIPNGMSVLGFSSAARAVALLAACFALLLESATRFKTYEIKEGELHELVRCGPSTSARNALGLRSSAIVCDMESGIVDVGEAPHTIRVDLGSLMRPHQFIVDLLRASFDSGERRAAATALWNALASPTVERGFTQTPRRPAIGDTGSEPWN